MNIKKIGIIGGGPGGLAALNELLHTSADGSSTINENDPLKIKLPSNPAFDEIVVFNASPDVGGVWQHTTQTDPCFPSSKEYSLPENVRPNLEPPTKEELRGASSDCPFIRPVSSPQINSGELWKYGGVYDHLFTNIPNRLMKFSSCFQYNIEETEKKHNPYFPFVKHRHVLQYLKYYAKLFNLKKYVRYNTSVEKVYKNKNQWNVVVCQIDYENQIENWYEELFDAIVVAVGRFNVPFFPQIDGMHEFAQTHPGVIIHSKSFRNTEDLIDKKVLLVGSNISSIDMLQYIIPKCKEVSVSSNTNVKITEKTNDPTGWIEEIMRDPSLKIKRVPRLKKFDGSNVEFEDGTILSDFDRIIFATGYHLYFPFLDIPENEGKEYIKLSSGRDDQKNYAKTKVENLYMYTFSIGDPTLAHVGIQHIPLFFLGVEANSIAISGVWSGAKKLPSREEQKEWCKKRLEGKNKGFQYVSESDIPSYFKKLQGYGPRDRLDLTSLLKPDEVSQARIALRDFFYRFVNGELKETD